VRLLGSLHAVEKGIEECRCGCPRELSQRSWASHWCTEGWRYCGVCFCDI